ncbi:hypothetical protein D3C85_963360 [compost metagenome]
MIERLLPAPDSAFEQGGFIEAPARLQRQALDRQVAGLIPGQGRGRGHARRLQRLIQGQGAGDVLLDVRRLGDQAHLAVLAERTPGVDGQAALRLFAVVAPAVALHPGNGGVDVPIAVRARDGGVAAPGFEAAAFQLKQVLLQRRAARRRDQIDRPAQLRPAEAQGVRPLPHLDVAGAQRVHALEVGKAVGVGEGHAVLGEQDAALVEALGDARAANGEAAFLAIAFLGQDAGDVPQGVGKALGEAVGIALGRDHGDGAGGAAEAVARLGHDGGVFGVAAAGDDDAVDDGGRTFSVRPLSLGGMSKGGRQAGADEQRTRRRSGLERHETGILKTEMQPRGPSAGARRR